jgi:hypothetical protein
MHGEPAVPGRRQGSQQLAGDRWGADSDEAEVGIGIERSQSAVYHDGGGIIPAEEVDGDPRGD